jgi:3-deoxy-D-manno-octulosonic-acid transferase
MMRQLYTFLLYLFSPFIVLRLYWKGRRFPAYRERLKERFSLGAIVSPPVDVWIHAVSLGEVVAATPLIDKLLEQQWRVLVTTMTPSGSQQVVRRFGQRVHHQYVPYDFPWALRRFFNKIQARVGIIMETELWPNLIVEATRANVSLFLANARISNHAFKQYEMIRFLLKPLLNRFVFIMAQSPLDATRFEALGASSERVLMYGNMKFDLQVNVTHEALAHSLKRSWGDERVTVIAASTHEGEEKQLVSALKALQQAIPHVVLLIAPRHPERFDAVHQLCQEQGFVTGRRSQPHTLNPECEIVVLDSLGELLSFYAVSHYAFVGGSWVSIGGHNVLEPIALQVPVFCGLFMQNSQSIINDLLSAQAIQQVPDASAFVNEVIALHQNVSRREAQVESAKCILIANQGTVARQLDAICAHGLGHPAPISEKT